MLTVIDRHSIQAAEAKEREIVIVVLGYPATKVFLSLLIFCSNFPVLFLYLFLFFDVTDKGHSGESRGELDTTVIASSSAAAGGVLLLGLILSGVWWKRRKNSGHSE